MKTLSQVEASTITCTLPNRDGEPCGKPGVTGLPAGVCQEHAIAVYRAIVKLAETTGR